MADLENNIPTLTNITHHGNEDMLNHFDAHQFDDKTDEEDEKEIIISLENASEPENINNFENSSIDDIPSIKIEDENITDIDSPDFSEAMQSIANKTIEKEPGNEKLKEKIDQAIADALPGIEAHLKESLYSTFDI